jgi:hypothetical protein
MPRKINESGNEYGKLKVISEELSTGKGARWLCECECGNQTIVLGIDLRSGNTSSCGCSYTIDEIGNTYGKYKVIGKAKKTKGAAYWVCSCECGKKKTVRGDLLRKGEAASCGQCNRPFVVNKTGFSTHPLYYTWSGMLQRCYNSNNPAFSNYGGRGIKVYLDWQSNPDSFYRWVEKNLGPRPEGYSLDRVDVYGNYEPGNLRWATFQDQANNRRLVLLSEEEYKLVMRFRHRGLNSEYEELCDGP